MPTKVVKDREGRVKQTSEQFEEFLKPHHADERPMEASRDWGLVYDWRKGILDEVALPHPLKVDAVVEAGISRGKISADILRDLPRPNLLVEADIPGQGAGDGEAILR